MGILNNLRYDRMRMDQDLPYTYGGIFHQTYSTCGHCTDQFFFYNIYSVTQSLSNSLLGDVVLDSFNNASRDEDNILDQIYKNQICSDIYYDDYHNIIRKYILTLE